MKDWFLALQRREQRLVAAGGIVAALIIVYGFIFAPLGRATDNTAARVATKESDLAWMHAAAAEIRQAGGAVRGANPNEPLVVIISRSTRPHGLSSALSGSQPTGANSIRVTFDNAPFDGLIEWLARLQAEQQLLIRTATIDAAPTPGRVRVSLTIERPAG